MIHSDWFIIVDVAAVGLLNSSMNSHSLGTKELTASAPFVSVRLCRGICIHIMHPEIAYNYAQLCLYMTLLIDLYGTGCLKI
jgi:hypothetical protein